MTRSLIAALLCLAAFTAGSDTLKPFTSDGCSAFPDGTLQQQSRWVTCCIRHDLAYWKGGSYAQRVQADRSLQRCVQQVGERQIADLMLAGVRVGGSPYWPTPFRWGYGWSYGRGYKPLSQEERQEVKAQLINLRLLLETLDKELEDGISR